MVRHILTALRITAGLTLLTGLLYPGIVTGVCQFFFPRQADGSLIVKDSHVIGSSLIGQNFTKREYFHPRPSAAGSDGYDASASTGSNLGPTSKKLADRVRANIERFRQENPDYHGPIPADLVTASGSGLDPDISPASAEVQAVRVAKARGVPPDRVMEIIARNVEPTWLGLIGEPRVNVLRLNTALDRQFPMPVIPAAR